VVASIGFNLLVVTFVLLEVDASGFRVVTFAVTVMLTPFPVVFAVDAANVLFDVED